MAGTEAAAASRRRRSARRAARPVAQRPVESAGCSTRAIRIVDACVAGRMALVARAAPAVGAQRAVPARPTVRVDRAPASADASIGVGARRRRTARAGRLRAAVRVAEAPVVGANAGDAAGRPAAREASTVRPRRAGGVRVAVTGPQTVGVASAALHRTRRARRAMAQGHSRGAVARPRSHPRAPRVRVRRPR